MTRSIPLLLALLAGGCSGETTDRHDSPRPVPSATASAATPRGLPADVVAFRQKRDACDELRGEEPYDKARAAELARAMQASCTGIDRALAGLKARYAGDAAVAAALGKYDTSVE